MNATLPFLAPPLAATAGGMSFVLLCYLAATVGTITSVWFIWRRRK